VFERTYNNKTGTPPERAFASVADAARILACSEKVVRSEIQRGRLPSYRVGRLIRIRITDLDQLHQR
jgi:excisionase family DNA binding protein